MKKITFWKKITSAVIPFWMPWGFPQWLGRVLAFLILLSALLILLSLFRDCHCDESESLPADLVDNGGFVPEPIENDTPGYPGTIEDSGPDLPSDSDNRIDPVDDDDIIDNPGSPTLIAGNKLNVILNSDAGDDTFKQFAKEFKGLHPDAKYKVAYYDTHTKLLQLNVPSAERESIKSNLNKQITDIDFKLFDESMFMGVATTPNDRIFKYPYYSWFYKPIQALDAWKITTGSPNVTIAIVDSYFDLEHPDLNGARIVKPYSVRFGSSNVAPAPDCPRIDPDPSHGGCIYAPFEHGSMVASQALGTMNNGAAMCGIAPKCKLMPVSMGHQFTTLGILQGLLYAIYQGADVVNISAGMVFGDDVKRWPVEDQIRCSEETGLSEADIWDYVFNLNYS